MVTPGPRLGLTAMAIAASIACQGKTGAPDGRDYPYVADALSQQAPTIEDAASATYWGELGLRIQLDHGEWTSDGGARVRLLPEFYAAADLNGDGAQNAAVILEVSNAGDRSGQYLAVLRADQLQTISLGTARIGAAVRARALRLDGRRMIVDYLRRGPGDAEGAMTEPATATFVFGSSGLQEVTAAASAR